MIKSLETLKYCTQTGVVCGWVELVKLLNEMIGFAIYLSVTITTLALAYAGWLLLISGGDPGAKTKAKTIITNCILGIIFILTAWLIVQFIVSNLELNPNYSAVEIKK